MTLGLAIYCDRTTPSSTSSPLSSDIGSLEDVSTRLTYQNSLSQDIMTLGLRWHWLRSTDGTSFLILDQFNCIANLHYLSNSGSGYKARCTSCPPPVVLVPQSRVWRVERSGSLLNLILQVYPSHLRILTKRKYAERFFNLINILICHRLAKRKYAERFFNFTNCSTTWLEFHSPSVNGLCHLLWPNHA